MSCKHIKREGESCALNNNCKYPNCMEESKYYTPEIEELHVGFDCEYSTLLNTKGSTHPNWEFEDDVYIGELDTFILKTIIIETVEQGLEMPVRVKYLDQKDIEEVLRVKQLKGDDTELNFQVLIDDRLFYEIDYNTITKELVLEEWIQSGENENNFNCYTFFRGTVKNKSELKQILKMTGCQIDQDGTKVEK